MAHAQYVRSCGKVSPLTSLGSGTTTDSTGRPYTGTAFLEFIPSLCVSERYDSNVYYAPPTPGLKRDDFVTDVNPMVRVNHNGEYVSGYLDIGGFGETYARNSNLNFFGTADTVYLSLDNSIKRLLPNASLSITEYVRYTPTPPGFSSTVAGTSPGSPVNIQNVYAQGILSYRANNLTNSGTVLTSYKITPLTSVNASYSNTIIRFGSSPVTSNLTLFDATTQTGAIGAQTRISSLDALNLNYSHTQSEFTPKTTSVTTTSSLFKVNTFKVDTMTLGWTRDLTPYLTGTVGGGFIVIEPGFTSYALNASIVINTPSYKATMSYARSAFPSFVGVSGPLIADIVSLSAIQKLALQWELNETASYSHSSGGGGQTATVFNSYFAGLDLYYWITKIWSTALSLDYMNYKQGFGPTQYSFDRYAVTLSLKATLN